jgi:hypothetical protein
MFPALGLPQQYWFPVATLRSLVDKFSWNMATLHGCGNFQAAVGLCRLGHCDPLRCSDMFWIDGGTGIFQMPSMRSTRWSVSWCCPQLWESVQSVWHIQVLGVNWFESFER